MRLRLGEVCDQEPYQIYLNFDSDPRCEWDSCMFRQVTSCFMCNGWNVDWCITACLNVTGSSRICKPTGKCLLPSEICDSIQDCPDDSDEVNCSQYTSVLMCLYDVVLLT